LVWSIGLQRRGPFACLSSTALLTVLPSCSRPAASEGPTPRPGGGVSTSTGVAGADTSVEAPSAGPSARSVWLRPAERRSHAPASRAHTHPGRRAAAGAPPGGATAPPVVVGPAPSPSRTSRPGRRHHLAAPAETGPDRGDSGRMGVAQDVVAGTARGGPRVAVHVPRLSRRVAQRGRRRWPADDRVLRDGNQEAGGSRPPEFIVGRVGGSQGARRARAKRGSSLTATHPPWSLHWVVNNQFSRGHYSWNRGHGLW
jgi:hypothetical protein